MRQLAQPITGRHCQHLECKAELIRHENESITHFNNRRYCNKSHSIWARYGKPLEDYDYIYTRPTIEMVCGWQIIRN